MSELRRVFDIDIDVSSKAKRDSYGTRAMIYNKDLERVMPHPSGIYMEPVPIDSVTGLCAFDYEYGNQMGFSKIDILTNSAYDSFLSKEELYEAIEREPDWKLLENTKFVEGLPHIGKHAELVRMVCPKSIEELADILALIRPGKQEYVKFYRKNPALVRKNLYLRPRNGGAYFKKSHAICYAVMIVAVMNKKSVVAGIEF